MIFLDPMYKTNKKQCFLTKKEKENLLKLH